MTITKRSNPAKKHNKPKRPGLWKMDFWQRAQDKSHAAGNGCIIWDGAKLKSSGYGLATFGYDAEYVHRLAWESEYGTIPEGYQIHHACPGGPNKLCFNVDHLQLVTRPEHAKIHAQINNRPLLDFPLKPREQVLLDMHINQDMSYREIADTLSISTPSVQSRMNYMRRKYLSGTAA